MSNLREALRPLMSSTPVGRFAIPIGNGLYYDAIWHTVRSEDQLGSHYLLSGQEEQAIHGRLFGPNPFRLLLVPSFECNLRCPHCYVGHLLEKPSGSRLGSTDPKKLIAFIRRAVSAFGPLDILNIVGGEPFLHCDAIRLYLEAGFPLAATTNGIFDFSEVSDVIGRMKRITFSIDGCPEQHNRSRKSLYPHIDPFDVTYRNLCRTVEAFPDLDVGVQGSMVDDDMPQDDAFRFFALMIGAGVRRSRIILGTSAATVNRPPIVSYMNSVPRHTRKSPCCDHLSRTAFVVYNNLIYGSYHRLADYSPLATLDDPVEDVVFRRKQAILDAMPMLHDSVCMKECRAVGNCWGLCTSACHVYKDGKPSSACDRAFKEANLMQIVQTIAHSSDGG